MLRNFWFPVLLTLAGAVSGYLGTALEGNQRRVWWTTAIGLWALTALSFVWGDPVRGPFAKLRRPGSEDQFSFHAGITTTFPIQRLKKGIDFSQVIGMPNRPIELWMRKTWWSGWEFKVTAKAQGGLTVLVFSEREVKYIAPRGDVNFDDHAFDAVGPDRQPFLQVVVSGDYEVYVNALLRDPTTALILKGDTLSMKPIQTVTQVDLLEPIFKYPSYVHRGERQ